MRTRVVLIPILLLGVALVAIAATEETQPQTPQYTSDFGLDPREVLLPYAGNRYVSLSAGVYLRFEGEDDGHSVRLETTVLEQTRPIFFRVDGQRTMAIARVVEERDWIDGELAEVSLHYYAACPRSGAVFALGEDVDVYENGRIVSHEGTWLVGRNGAEPGLVMPGVFLLGSRYCQKMAPGVAVERAEHIEMGVEVETPAGVFRDCVTVLETTPLDPTEEVIKIYAPGVGLVADDSLQLVEFRR